MIDRSQEADLRRFKWVPLKAQGNRETLLKDCYLTHYKQLPGKQPLRGKTVLSPSVSWKPTNNQKVEMTALKTLISLYDADPASTPAKNFYIKS